MANPQLVDYLRQAFAEKHAENEIRATLAKQGWSDFDVGLAWQEAQQPVEKKKKQKSGDHISGAELLLFIGGVIIIIAAVSLLASNWDDLGSIGRILAALIPNLILVAVGLGLKNNPNMRHASHAFLVTGGLVVPFTLGILVNQFVPDAPYDSQLFVVSMFTLAAYAYAVFRFRDLIWIGLAVIMAIIAYGALLSIIHIEQIITSNPFAWAYLILGIALILIGTSIERSGWKYFARAPYFFGSLIFVLSTSTLGLTGTLFGEAWLNTSYDFAYQQLISITFIGLIYLGIGWWLRGAGSRSLEELRRLRPAWDFLGVMAVTGGFYLIGNDYYGNAGTGNAIIYSFIGLGISLSFFYLAVRLQNRQYFQAGALLLAVGLLKIGSTYFADTLGWPVILMFFGLLFMGGGYYLNRLQRRFFRPKDAAPHAPPPQNLSA